MPFGQALLAATEGAAFGFFPILWIVINAIWVYNMTVETGHFDVLRRSFAQVSDDQRIQAIIIAFCFGALLEALAGFGTPVAITVVMLIALGFRPLKAAALALVANTAPVAFGALATPIVTLSTVTPVQRRPGDRRHARRHGRPADADPRAVRAARPGFIVDGQRGIRQTWLAGAGLRRGVRDRAVRGVQLHLGPADRHRRLAAVRGCGRPAAARLAARRDATWRPRPTSRSRSAAAAAAAGATGCGDGLTTTAGHDRRRRTGGTLRAGTVRGDEPASAPRPAGAASRTPGHPRRDRPGVRAVPDHHRRFRDRPAARHQAADRQDHPHVAPGRGCTWSAPAASRRPSPTSPSTGWPRAARCCSSPA